MRAGGYFERQREEILVPFCAEGGGLARRLECARLANPETMIKTVSRRRFIGGSLVGARRCQDTSI